MPQAPKSLHVKSSRQRDRHRPNSRERGYNRRWEKASRAWLEEQFSKGNVRCAECGELLMGRRRDIHVDHIVDHKGNQELFWDESNWQALHVRCHSRKTMRENRPG